MHRYTSNTSHFNKLVQCVAELLVINFPLSGGPSEPQFLGDEYTELYQLLWRGHRVTGHSSALHKFVSYFIISDVLLRLETRTIPKRRWSKIKAKFNLGHFTLSKTINREHGREGENGG